MVKRYALLAHKDFPDIPADVVAASDYDALAARLAEAERDAARWRWFREHASVRAFEHCSAGGSTGEGYPQFIQFIDKIVDGLRAASSAEAVLPVKDQ